MSASSVHSPAVGPGLDRPLAVPSAARRRLLAALFGGLLLSACGKKGELELPPRRPEPSDDPLDGEDQ